MKLKVVCASLIVLSYSVDAIKITGYPYNDDGTD